MAADFSIQGALIKKSHYSSSRNFLDLTLTTSSLKNIFDYIDDPIENYGSIAHVKSFFLGEWSRIFSGDCRELYKMFFTKSDIESLEGWEDLDEKIDFFFFLSSRTPDPPPLATYAPGPTRTPFSKKDIASSGATRPRAHRTASG